MQLTLGQFVNSQWAAVPPVVEEDLQGKTVIVTGANNGIGLEAAKHFARMKPQRLVLACRSKERGEAALDTIRKETGYENPELWILDLSRFASVKVFAERFEQEGGGRLDILVENAAVIPANQFEETEDGWETTFQVNNLSTSLLALLMLPKMVKTAKEFNTRPKLVLVSSEVHYWAKIDDSVLNAENPLKFYGSKDNYNSTAQGNRYNETKLLNILFVRALNDRLQDKSVIVDAVNPGYCLSGLRSSFSGARAVLDWFMEKALARTSEEGSRQVVWAALGNGNQQDSMCGAYVSNMAVTEPSDYVISEEGKKIQNRLWDNLIDELSKVDSTVQDVVNEYLAPSPGKDTKPLTDSVFHGI